MTRPATLLAALLLLTGAAQAQLTIEIIGGGANQIPIAVLPFAGESALPHSITEIVEQDLSRSGRFRAIFVGGVSPLPTDIAQVDFPEWKSRLA
ncbi:MAG TPA: Tol-Pal system protein TolB, partial [Burkholderiales bacterium]|nr:Tol-Pal system protein TolB [Burkholderiales bacterium]